MPTKSHAGQLEDQDQAEVRFAVACVDVGSVARGNFGWAMIDHELSHGDHPQLLVDAIVARLDAGVSVALGMEAPLFVPVPTSALHLGRGRQGEGSRPWSAGAGCGALATGVVQTAWIARAIREAVQRQPTLAFDLDQFPGPGPTLLIWEALVSGTGKLVTPVATMTGTSAHVIDAVLGAEAMHAIIAGQSAPSPIDAGPSPLSLAAAAFAWAGWEVQHFLSEPCVVART